MCVEPPFLALLKVLRVVIQEKHDDYPLTVYTVLLDGNVRLQATAYHAFKVMRDSEWVNVTTDQLQSEDQMWVDVPMYLGDGTLYAPPKID